MSVSNSKGAAAAAAAAGGSSENGKPHALCVPFPLQSHVKAMLNFAKLLHHTANFHITFVNTDFNHRRLLRSRGPDSLDGLPDFRFESIPDGLPPSDPNAGQDPLSVSKAVKNNLLAPFFHLVATKLSNTGGGVPSPPVTCIVADTCMAFVYAVGEELGVPVFSLCTIPACALMAIYHTRPLISDFTRINFRCGSKNGNLETIVDWIPGLNHLRFVDLPCCLGLTDPDDFFVNFSMEVVEMASRKASGVIINTFDELERDVMEALAPAFPHLYTVGPIHSLVNRIPEDSPIKSIGSNLWREEAECLRWLDSKAPNSVIYVNFGSDAVVTPDQLIEFAWGLAESNRDFLWVIRPDVAATSGGSVVLTPEFEEQTRGRAFIAGWCPQEQVLNHASTGVFLTHCGWNSTLESLSAGVPMICWPLFGDQPTICRYSCLEWGVGVEMERDVKRGDLKRLTTEVMEGEKWMRLKEKALKWKESAAKAAAPTGSTAMNIEKFVKQATICET